MTTKNWRVVGRTKNMDRQEILGRTYSPRNLLKKLYNSIPRNPGKFPYSSDYEIKVQKLENGIWEDRDMKTISRERVEE